MGILGFWGYAGTVSFSICFVVSTIFSAYVSFLPPSARPLRVWRAGTIPSLSIVVLAYSYSRMTKVFSVLSLTTLPFSCYAPTPPRLDRHDERRPPAATSTYTLALDASAEPQNIGEN